MDAKTIVAIVLVAFIIGACIWLNIQPCAGEGARL